MSKPEDAKKAAGFVPAENEESQEKVPDEKEEIVSLSEDPEKRMDQVAEILKKMDPQNAPSGDQLKQWKAMFKDVFILNLYDRAYVYRGLKRQEWIQTNANPDYQKLPQYTQDEQLSQKCLLWPRFDVLTSASSPAGLFTTLAQQIYENSLFLDPQTCAALTLKL